jgi:Mrp family chromosome partitioning ATPase
LRKLNTRFDSLVPKEAAINTYEGNISVASQEYVEIQKKYNQATMAFNSSSQVKQIEMAMPGNKLPSKKILLVLVSGIGSLVICLLVIFLLFYLDNSLKYVDELSNKTNLPVLGTLPYIVHSSLLNLNELWAPDNDSTIDREFRNQLRSVRFETENCMEGNHMLVVTSLGEGEGKTFLSMCLASAYTMVNKKVLLIDGNFNNNTITALTEPAYLIEDFLTGRTNIPYPGEETDITIIGNKGQDISLFEINTEAIIRQKIQQLKDAFDIIIVESPALDTMNQAKEWITVTDKVIASFEANKVISGEKKIHVGYLKSLNNKYLGWVMNRLTEDEDTPKSGKRFFKNKADI